MHYHSKNAKTNKKKKKFNDVIMTSSFSPWAEQTWFGLNRSREEKKFGQKLCNFGRKKPVFHPQTLIHQSWPKNCTKTHKQRTIRNPNFRNPINWVPKNQKKMMGFPSKGVFYKSPTSIWLQNGELTPNKKNPKIGFQNKMETLNNPNKNAT